jgi:chromosome segregation protein
LTALLTRLRIAGFKSFAEPAALDILPGLTGIVGPNGCGKSNVVEALRWAMGESSARSLRGGEMDDVIFAGTAARSSRNLAEVTITLQRPEGGALPDPFGAEEELQVTRRIERGAGSQYRANGREMRARDVQTLFADMASGAKSSAMVSQGRVAALVNARPEDRRAVLEEAAGITGLHARRHEAELKLRAAETNLTRAEELRTQLETGREGLRKQAKQALRYRNISGLVRAAETDFLAVLHARAMLAVAAATQAQGNAQESAAAAEQAVEAAAAELEAAEAGLPAPREAEAEARSLLERRRLEAEALAEEADRAGRALEAAAAQLALIEADLADAAGVRADAATMLDRLTHEAAQHRARQDALPAEIAGAEAAADAARQATQAAEARADEAAAQAADAAAAARQAATAVDQAGKRLEDADATLAQARRAYESARAKRVDPAMLRSATAAASAAEEALGAARAESAAASLHREACVAEAAAAAARLARETERAQQAEAALGDADSRLARLGAALAEVTRDLAQAESGRIGSARLENARQAASKVQADVEAAAQQAASAETAYTEAGAERLRALTARDQLTAASQRLHAAATESRAKLGRLTAESVSLAESLAAIEADQPDASRLAAASDATAQAEAAAAAAAVTLSGAAERRADAERSLTDSRAASSAAAAELARLTAEADGMRRALGDADSPASVPLLDSIEVPPGLELAFGAVFADAPPMLEDPAAARFWRLLPALAAAAPPPGCTTLDKLVRAPEALARVLAHTALLPDGEDGGTLQAGLAPGWVLVSRQGAVWRWDGQTARAGAPNAAASRLRLRARLRDLDQALEAAREADEAARSAVNAAEQSAQAARAAEAAARSGLTEAEAGLAVQRKMLGALEAAAQGAAARLASLRPAHTRIETALRQAEAALADDEAALASLPDPAHAEAALRDATAAATASRAALDAARAAREAARAAFDLAGAALRRLEAEAARADSQEAALRPQRDRLAAEHEEAQRARDARAAERDSLPDLAALRAAAAAAQMAEQDAIARLDQAKTGADQAELARAQATQTVIQLERGQAEAELAATAAKRMLDTAEAAQAREQAAFDAVCAEQAALPDTAALAEEAAAARAALAACRAGQVRAEAALAALTAALSDTAQRIVAISADIAGWSARHDEAGRRHAALDVRVRAARADCAALADMPARLAARAAESGDVLAAAEADHAQAAAALRAAEDRLRDAARAQRDADAAQSAIRELLARGEGAAETAEAGLRAVLERAAERLGENAELPDIVFTEGNGEAEEEKARRKLERLQRERDDMGPVNLRAELELDEVDARIAAIEAERDELTTAIAKLRGGIGHLNREGRERLAAVFTQVDTHFRTLFTRMMGGGRAHLALTGSDDPLEAGLEIYAEPPGKKLSALSLLSGGEQALTALSLIFAVFRCTPAPVAVLDEVDAPLDDVNVDRFCGLLEDVVRDTGTRFLVVTHHQLTMSRMDRLFGVTMQERGVSRLLSVDLRRAAEMVAPVAVAAE